MATIRFVTSINKWQAIVRRKHFKQQSRVFVLKSEAKTWARKTEAELDYVAINGYRMLDRITLNDLIDRYIKEKKSRVKNYRGELSRLRCLQHYLGSCQIKDLSATRIASFRDLRLEVGRSNATVVRDLQTLSKLLRIAGNEWNYYLPMNPVSQVDKPKITTYRIRRISKLEEQILLQHSKSDMHAMIIFAIETAMRLGEIMQLQWTDIKDNVAILRNTKNCESRYVPLTDRAIELLKSLSRSIHEDRIFHHWKTVSGFESSWQKFKKRQGLIDLRFHDLRHEAISRMFEKGLNHMEVSSISGHKSLLTLRKYTHYHYEYLHKKLNKTAQ